MAQERKYEGAFYAVDGAFYQCQYGSIPSKIQVLANQAVLVQNKPVVTEDELTFQLQSMTFGVCGQNPDKKNPVCLYASGMWDADTMVEHGGKKVATEDSTMKCSVFGGQISCLYHGQVLNVSPSNLSDFNAEEMNLVNPFAVVFSMSSPNQAKPVSITTIGQSAETVRIGGEVSFTAFRDKVKKNKVAENVPVHWAIHTRKSRTVVVEDKKNNKKGTAKPQETKSEERQFVHELLLYKNSTSSFSAKFSEPGVYYIEGFGSNETLKKYLALKKSSLITDNKPPFDAKCSAKVDVLAENKIVNVVAAPIMPQNGVYYVKQGNSITFTVQTVLPFEGERESVECIVKTKKEEAVLEEMYSYDAKKLELKFTPFNAEEDYKLTFKLYAKENPIIECSSQQTLFVHSYNEAVVRAVIPNLDAQEDANRSISLRRPGDTLLFSVEKKGGDDGQDWALDKVDWTVSRNNKQVMEVKNDSSSFVYLFKTVGVYTIVADLKDTVLSDGGVLGAEAPYSDAKGKFSRRKISHTVNVENNSIVNICVGANRGKRFVGGKYPIKLEFYYGQSTTSGERKMVVWSSDGADENELKRGVFYPQRAGTVTITAKLFEKEKSISITVLEAEAQVWNFCDSKKHAINKIGRNMQFGIMGAVPAWACIDPAIKEQRTVTVTLYSMATALKSFTVQLSSKGEFFIENVDVEKDVVSVASRKIKSWGEANRFVNFTVSRGTHVIKLKGMCESKVGGVYLLNSEMKVHQKIFIDGYFSDSEGGRLTKILNYGDKVNIHLQIFNVSREELKDMKVLVRENKYSYDSVVWEKVGLELDKDGCVDIELPTSEGGIKQDDHKSGAQPRLFYFCVERLFITLLGSKFHTEAFIYPQSPGDLYDLNVEKRKKALVEAKDKANDDYKEKMSEARSYIYQLKLSIPDEKNEFAKAYDAMVPVVVGEKKSSTERGEKENTKCFCCRDFTVAEVTAMIRKLRGVKKDAVLENIWEKANTTYKEGDVDEKSIFSFTNELNVAFRRYGINKCIQKITFLAIAAVETGNFKSSVEQPSGFKSSKSLYRGRGLMQLTNEEAYKKYNGRIANVNILEKPQIVGSKLHYIVDSGATYFTNIRFKADVKWKSESKVAYEKKRAEKFKESVSIPYRLSLSQLSLLMESVDEGKYYFLINKLLNGYLKGQVEEGPNGWEDRKKKLETLKTVFNYDKSVCMGVEEDFPVNSTEWHDPLDVMQMCFYSFNGRRFPYNSTFHYRGKTPHQGIDLYAEVGTPIYACLDGRIVFCGEQTGYGKIIILEIYEPSQILAFKERRKSNFESIFIKENQKEMSEGPEFDKDASSFYFAYAHLSEFHVIDGDSVKSGQQIGLSGETGNAKGTKGPHVHFEIRSKKFASGMNSRCNPILYLDYEQYFYSNEGGVGQGKKGKDEVIIYRKNGDEQTVEYKDFAISEFAQYNYVSKK
ncbi:MAG: peptidoglycan DD-metalloendopeptidase family protein [Paludibacteraceae bacterium]|nr:peptidoglycan DD-metalloendopeptidase family protein [Paludibacteraceae bacterium]